MAGNKNAYDGDSLELQIVDNGDDNSSILDDDIDDEEFQAENDDDQDKKKSQLAKEESKAVFWLRAALLFVLGCSAVCVALGVLFYVRDSEQDDFEQFFDATAANLYRILGDELDTLLGGVDNFALTMLSYAKATNQTFPFFAMPLFAEQASNFLAQSNAYFMTSSLLVRGDQRRAWEDWAEDNHDWVAEVQAVTRQDPDLDDLTRERGYDQYVFGREIHEAIRSPDGNPPIVPRPDIPANETYLVAWQSYPLRIHFFSAFGSDGFTRSSSRIRSLPALESRSVVLGDFQFFRNRPDPWQNVIRFSLNMPIIDRGPMNLNFSQLDLNQVEPLGVINIIVQFPTLYADILPDNAKGIHIVTSNECDQAFTYELNGGDVSFVNLTHDAHETKYDHLGQTVEMWALSRGAVNGYRGPPINREYCPISVSLYPSQKTEDTFTTNEPTVLALVAGLIFVFAGALFLLYDWWVERRQTIVLSSAQKSGAIVESLFPEAVRERLFESEQDGKRAKKVKSLLGGGKSSTTDPTERGNQSSSRPVADLYPEASVMFADIAGFTAWSSIRDPTKVFTLLEAIYGQFDGLAKKRKVFKVETIGDCYVAVVGLPTERKDHAVVMAKFAHDCVEAMNKTTSRLVVQLGPDTADLEIRIGIHSGPVTAGVLRGDRARFQLFGDTVNTAARMESNGIPGRVQASEATARALIDAGKNAWVTKRSEMVQAKGKGKMQTYWIEIQHTGSTYRSSDLSTDAGSATSSSDQDNFNDKNQGLIAWNTETLVVLLRDIVSARTNRGNSAGDAVATSTRLSLDQPLAKAILKERKDSISFVPEGPESAYATPSADLLDEALEAEVKDFVTSVASMYSDIPFHNFEHASHSAVTLINTIHHLQSRDADGDDKQIATIKNDMDRFALDPVAVFGCVFAVLIHCADHAGISNKQLAKEKDRVSVVYQGHSLNEQNAFDLAWTLLMDDKFASLRNTIATTEAEWARFRQVVVNCVLATDFSDEEFQKERIQRWEDCFGSKPAEQASNDGTALADRKATIVMEHIVQSAVVGHTMQHWHIFQKWYERVVMEAQQAFLDGRLESEPDKHWYQHELSFFDSFVIPLAMKLDSTGYFGGIGREHVEYAQKNRVEWEEKGLELVSQAILRLSTNAIPEEVVIGE